ncbi:helix-turn-helix transcriptional regulator [Paenibacillus doosanensis]|uniref:helix-turn-helix transcriptional regulator n=1 Tax=Paenibacillus doosanensis TaxID=1229154 RepID=UPI0021808E1C|nr:helix-turn-helix transcriptional regulator [Paenibacillus doosanensis]MCS7464777.1 helix-turn-helix transcriptional regulator [Paenibacillus doosanensis]
MLRKALQSKLYRKFLLRHLLILAVTGLLLLFTNIISLSNTYQRLTDNTHRSMAHMTDLLDTRIVDLQKLTLTLSHDTKLLPYQLQEQLQYPYEIAAELSKLKTLSADLDSIGLFYRNPVYPALENVIFTDTGIYTPESYSQLVSEGRIASDILAHKLGQLRSPMLLSSLANEGQHDAQEQVLLLLVPLDNTPYSSGIMIYKLNYSALLSNFQTTIDSDSSLIVFDQYNMPIFYIKGNSELGWNELAHAAHSNVRIPGYLLLQETSEKQKFLVVNAIRRHAYFHEYYSALSVSVSIFLLSLTLGLVLCFRAARKSYQPIQELSSRFPTLSADKSIAEDSNELEQLTRYIEQMRDETIHLSNKMHNQEVLTRNQLLLALLMGKLNVDNTTPNNRSTLHKLFGTRNISSVLVIIFDDYNAKVSKEPLSEQWLMKYAICNVLENLSGEHGVNYALDLAIDNGIVGIVSWNKEFEDQWEARSREFAEQIITFMKRHFSLSISCTVGEPQPTNDLHQSFSSATALAEYRIFAGKQSIITPSELSQQNMENNDTDKRHISDLAEALHIAVCSKNSEKLELLIEELEARFTRLEDAPTFRLTFQKIIFTLNELVNNIPLSHREAIKYKLDALTEYQSKTVAEACATLLDAASSIQESLGEDSNNNRLYHAMLAYVADNYMDCNLSLSTVAEALSLTPSYVTRYFKTKNGLPLMQYVSKIRIEKAKELLKDSQLSIKDIVAQVGFVDENNFSRAFRKREGVSPSQYRSVHYG